MTKPYLTQAEFLACEGSRCPGCKSDNIEAASPESDGDLVWMDTSCHNCNATWTEHFHLASYESFKEGS